MYIQVCGGPRGARVLASGPPTPRAPTHTFQSIRAQGPQAVLPGGGPAASPARRASEKDGGSPAGALPEEDVATSRPGGRGAGRGVGVALQKGWWRAKAGAFPAQSHGWAWLCGGWTLPIEGSDVTFPAWGAARAGCPGLGRAEPPQLSPPAPGPAAVPVLGLCPVLLCPRASELGVEGCSLSPPIHCPCLFKTGCRLGVGG